METNFLTKKYTPKMNASNTNYLNSPSSSSVQLNSVQHSSIQNVTKQIQLLTARCPSHQSEILTNYCSSPGCLTPLCPDCIENHLDCHKQTKVSPDIESIKQARVKGIDKLVKLIQFIVNELDNLQPPKSIDKILSQTNIQLKNIKQFVLKTIDDYFAHLQETLALRLRESAAMLKKIQNSHLVMKRMLDELRNLTQVLRLNDEATPGTIKKVIEINSTSLLNSFTSELQQYSKECKKVQINVKFDQVKFRQNIDDNIKIQFTGNTQINTQSKSLGLVMQDNIRHGKYATLHFFETGSNNLHLIEVPGLNHRIIALKSNFQVPEFHNSILLSNGEIWLSGGFYTDKKNNYDVSKYNLLRNSFDPKFTKVIERSSHSMCQYNGYVYILGGYGEDTDDQESRLKVVQRISMQTGVVNLQTPCLIGGKNISIVRDINIFKISSEGLQIYNMKKKIWSQIRVKNLLFFESCSGININQQQILIFGGYEVRDQNDPGVPIKTSFIIDISDLGNVHIRDKGKYDLPIEGGFRNNTPLMYYRQLYALQNIDQDQDQQISRSCLDGERTILKFDGRKWQSINI